jgi:hypothetical protein
MAGVANSVGRQPLSLPITVGRACFMPFTLVQYALAAMIKGASGSGR